MERSNRRFLPLQFGRRCGFLNPVMNLKLLFRLLLLAAVVTAEAGCADMESAADNTTVGEPSMMTKDDDSHGWGAHVGQAGGRQ